MRFTEIFVRRPVLATVANLVVVLIGLVCFDRLTVREYPNIDVPTVTVSTDYRGAPASVVESTITKPLEDSISGIDGIDYIKSISRAENSQITVVFRLNRNPDEAASDVRDRVSRAQQLLPDEADSPIVAKTEADAQPVIWMAGSSTRQSLMEVSDYMARTVKDRLQTLPGVSSVRVFGERKPSMRVWLDPQRMAAFTVTTQDIETALTRQNADIPAGRIESTAREFTVRTTTDVNTPEQFRQLVITNKNGTLVRIGDVAKVEIAPEDERTYTRFNGVNSVAIGIIKQSTANPLEVSRALREALPDVQKHLPQGMSLNISYDSSVFIEAAIFSVYETIAVTIALVALVIFLFLGSFRATLVPLVTIPISIIGSFALIALFGFTINTLTLLALVLAIGLVVDDAIVVLENIYRHIEEGMRPFAAAIKGISEITFAVIAMTLTLAAVFAPLGFATGRTGKLFMEFALTLAGTVLISGYIALTLSPMMCSKILKAHEGGIMEKFRHKIDTLYNRVSDTYMHWLDKGLAERGLVVMIATLSAAGMGLLAWAMPSELAPTEDRGVFFTVMMAPEGSTPEYLDSYARQVEAVLGTIPEQAWGFTAVGFPISTNAFAPVGLQEWSKRSRSQMEIVQSVFPRLFGIPGIMAFAINPPSLGQHGTSKPVEIVIQTSGSYEDLDRIVSTVMNKARANTGLVNLDTDLKLNKPELLVTFNRDKMADLGISVDTVGRTLETMLGGKQVTRFKRGGDQYNVMLQVDKPLRASPDALSMISVRAADGSMVQLSNLVSLHEGVAPRELNHFDKLRAATITSSLNSGYSLNEALQFMEQAIREAGGPDVQITYGGQTREYYESSASIALTFLLALGFIYLVLSAQFESFVVPVTIMLAVPLAMFGALLTLRITGGTLNVYSEIGLLTLVGLITKHGIMLVEFANVQREHGKNPVDAMKAACLLRLRPILMTTSAMVLGAVPLALATGAGAESREQIGWVIVGGMTVGTLLTLFVIPVIYTFLARHSATLYETEAAAEGLKPHPLPDEEAAPAPRPKGKRS